MIRRLIQLVLDRAAAQRAAQETQRALDKGTDPKKPKQNLGVIGRAMDGIKGAALRLGGVLAAAFGVRAIVRFGKESIRIAAESEAIWNRLAGQLDAVGVNFSDVEAEVRKTARALQDTTRVGDEDFAAVLTELVGISGDYGASLREVRTVADLAAAKQIDLRTAAQLVGRVMVGETGTLSRYGIIVEEGADAMEVLRSRFKGMADNEGKTLEGTLARLTNEWTDMKQAIGEAMIAAGGGTSVLETVIGTVKGLTIWITENRVEIANWGTLLIRVFRAVYESVEFVIRTLFNFGQVIGDITVIAGAQLQKLITDSINRVARGANWLIAQLNRLPGVDIDFTFGQLPVDQLERMIAQHSSSLAKNFGDIADAVWDLGDAYLAVGEAARDAASGQREAATVPPPPPPVVPQAGEEDEADEGRFRRHLDRLAAAREAARQYREEELQALQEKAGEVAESMTSAFEGFFTAAATGFEGTGNVFAGAVQAARSAGAAIVGALVQGRAEEQVAAGTAALASGIWPPNPAAWLSAGKHFLAAALYRAIPGVIKGGGGGASGGFGGGVGALPRGAVGTSVPGTQQLPGSDVHIYMDPLNPADARVQRLVRGAQQRADQRFGDMNIYVHSRSGA